MQYRYPKSPFAFLVSLFFISFLFFTGCTTEVSDSPSSSPGKHRIYYIAAEDVDWDYAPSGQNLVYGRPFDDMEMVYTKNSESTIGSVNKKALYFEYTDSTFTTRKQRAPEDAYLGMLGPIIRAEVGDTIDVFYINKSTLPTSLHPHGVSYKKSSEGSPGNDGTDGAGSSIAPGDRYHYIWMCPERSGPAVNDPSSIVWAYHSHVHESSDLFAGLIGAIIITRKGSATADAHPKDVDNEFITLFMVMDENQSPFVEENSLRFIPDQSKIDPDIFEEGNKKHAVNGFLYGNMPMPTMNIGKRICWYLIGMGNEVDVHTAHWHGNTVTENGTRQDVVSLFPTTFKQADMLQIKRVSGYSIVM